jgi:hypothetical protein
MKRFIIGFVAGVALMYWYLQRVETDRWNTSGWFDDAASNYRDDRQHRAADEVLGESGNR